MTNSAAVEIVVRTSCKVLLLTVILRGYRSSTGGRTHPDEAGETGRARDGKSGSLGPRLSSATLSLRDLERPLRAIVSSAIIFRGGTK